MRSDRERINDMLEATERIEKYARRGRDAFETDELIQNWMVRHIQILGEAAARLSPELKAENPQLPWRSLVGMRNILVHDYFGIDVEAVWQTVQSDIPALRAALEGLRDRLATPDATD